MRKLRLTAAGILLGLLIANTYEMVAPRRMPAGQPRLVHVEAEGVQPLRAAFNAAADRTRLLVLLSPT